MQYIENSMTSTHHRGDTLVWMGFLQLQESEKNSTTAVFLSSAEFYGLLAFCLGITKASLPILLSVIK